MLGKNWVEHLQAAHNIIENLDSWDLENLNDNLMKKIEKKGFKTGDFFMDLRIAIAGSKFTPPINDSIVILGKEETLKRINKILSDK